MERKTSFRRRLPKKPFAARAKDGCRQFTAFMFSNVGIIILVVVYMIGGAFIFVSIESKQNDNAIHLNESMFSYRKNLSVQLWNITIESNPFDQSRYENQINNEIMKYQEEIVYAVKRGWPGSFDTAIVNTWTITTALLYSLTVITTIGYGITTPNTTEGKIMTIAYAIIGMPLFLLYLSNIGDVLAKSFKWTYAKVCLCRICPGVARRREYRIKRKNNQMTEDSDDVDNTNDELSDEAQRSNTISSIDSWIDHDTDSYSSIRSNKDISVPITTCLIIIIGYIVLGAVIFQRDLLTGCYFCFVSLSSIGFGDVIPGKIFQPGDLNANLSQIDTQFIICVIYLLLGMALIAMCFNLMQEQVINNLRAIKRAIKRCFRCHRCRHYD